MSAGCKPFKCQEFYSENNETCVYVINGTTNQTMNETYVRTCETNKSCEATKWISITDAVSNATCDVINVTTVTNFTVPGDTCTNDTECFNGFYYNVSCKEGICTTEAPDTNANCTFFANRPGPENILNATKSCPVGTYCNGTTCIPQLEKDQDCSAFDQCKTGYGCLQVVYPEENATIATQCKEYWTLGSGLVFNATSMRTTGNVLTYIDACKTHHVIPNDTENFYECRTAHKSNYTKKSDLERAGPDSNDCNFTSSDDPNDATNSTVQSDGAKCGFNKGAAAYCNKRKGDQWFQSTFSKVRDRAASGLSCHAHSTLTTCANAAKVIGEELLKEWTRELLATDDNHGYALYADNDACVAESITAEYWQGDAPGSDFSDSLTLSSFVAIMLAISTLFYMF